MDFRDVVILILASLLVVCAIRTRSLLWRISELESALGEVVTHLKGKAAALEAAVESADPSPNAHEETDHASGA